MSRQDEEMSYRKFVAVYGKPFQFNWFAPLSLFMIDQLRLESRLSKVMYHVQQRLSILYGAGDAKRYAKMFIAQLISVTLLVMVVFLILSVLNGSDLLLIAIGGCIALIVPFMLFKDLERKVERRRRQIVMELPIFLNKLILLINAGETVKQALIRSVSHRTEDDDHPIYKELLIVLQQLHNNYSFQQAMEEFSRRCGVQEVSLFVNTIVLNYRRGGTELVAALRGLAHQLWMTRQNLARTLGEEASAKLVFPLIMIFVVVVVIVGAPAVMMLNL